MEIKIKGFDDDNESRIKGPPYNLEIVKQAIHGITKRVYRM